MENLSGICNAQNVFDNDFCTSDTLHALSVLILWIFYI